MRASLAGVNERVSGLEKTVTEESQRRKSQNAQRLKDIRDTITRLEKALNTEIKRRVEASKTLQTLTEHMANEMLGRLTSKIDKIIDELATTLEDLVNRCETAEQAIHELKGEIPSKLQAELVSIARDIQDIRDIIDDEKRVRVERERALERRISQLQYTVESKIECESTERKDQVEILDKEIKAFDRDRHRAQEKFGSFTMEELAISRKGIAEEIKTREQSDDEIVQAINHYTTALQKGLRNANLR